MWRCPLASALPLFCSQWWLSPQLMYHRSPIPPTHEEIRCLIMQGHKRKALMHGTRPEVRVRSWGCLTDAYTALPVQTDSAIKLACSRARAIYLSASLSASLRSSYGTSHDGSGLGRLLAHSIQASHTIAARPSMFRSTTISPLFRTQIHYFRMLRALHDRTPCRCPRKPGLRHGLGR
jgi:hypothetical protein